MIFFFLAFLTSLHITGSCWFPIMLGCVCLKKTHEFVINITHRFLWAREKIFFKRSLLRHSVSSDLSISFTNLLIALKNNSLFPFLFFFQYLLIFYLLTLENLFIILKGYSLSSELCFLAYCLRISSHYVCFCSFDDSNDLLSYIMKKIVQKILKTSFDNF